MNEQEPDSTGQQSPALPPCKDLQGRFDEASRLRIPPYNWAPPVWDRLEGENPNRRFPDNCTDINGTIFADTRGDVAAEIAAIRNAVTELIREKKLVSPLEDYNHVDPNEFSDVDIERLREPPAKPDKGRALSFAKLKALAGSESSSMRKLEFAFKGILSSFELLCLRLNQVLDEPNRTLQQKIDDYNLARDAYIDRLRDLDDHEPHRKGLEGMAQPGERGYGRIIKWLYVVPTILNGRIVELRVIVHWNPHSSSSGKPILHA